MRKDFLQFDRVGEHGSLQVEGAGYASADESQPARVRPQRGVEEYLTQLLGGQCSLRATGVSFFRVR